MRRRLCQVIACATVAGGAGACAMVSGIDQFSAGESSIVDATDGPPLDQGMHADAEGDVTTPADEGGPIAVPEGGQEDANGTDKNDAAQGGDGSSEGADTGADRDAGLDGAASDAEARSDAADTGCTAVQHSNGLGGSYFSCAIRDTYGSGEAQAACASAMIGACSTQTILCGLGDTETFECAAGADGGAACVCWTYEYPNAGHVRVSQLGALCQCPTASDPAWH